MLKLLAKLTQIFCNSPLWKSAWHASLLAPELVAFFFPPRLLNLSLTSDLVPQQDVIDVIIHVGRNPQGRSLAWRYFREKWEVLNARWVSSFVGCLIVCFKSLFVIDITTATAAVLSDSAPFSYPLPTAMARRSSWTPNWSAAWQSSSTRRRSCRR